MRFIETKIKIRKTTTIATFKTSLSNLRFPLTNIKRENDKRNYRSIQN